MIGDFTRTNEESRNRLLALVEPLDEPALRQRVEDDWTIAALLAHAAQIAAVLEEGADR